LEAPEILIEAIERGQDAQGYNCQGNPARLFGRRDLDNEKKDHNITDQAKEKIAADGIVYRVKGIEDGQDKKDNEWKGKRNPS
jgi:hypothetical protein